MKLTKILICLLIFWTGTLSASPYFSFKKYQVEDGLSHNTVWCFTGPVRRTGYAKLALSFQI